MGETMVGEYSDGWMQYLDDESTSNKTLSPTNSNSKEPIRRRSRASKKTPITHLNANTTNFRALVQQFTGYRHQSATTLSFVKPREGPVNLNFATDPTKVSLGYDHYDFQEARPVQPQHHQQGLMHHVQGQQSGCSFDNYISSDHEYTSSTTTSGIPAPDRLMEDFSVLENISLHELIGDDD